jgi:hypothetical protein
MPALYPMMAPAENFCAGDCVRKFVSERAVTPYLGVVTQVVPSTQKIWVEWPTEHSQESPELLIKVNPAFAGMPTVRQDSGYSSWEKTLSDRMQGHLPKRCASERMAIRIANTFATKTIGKLIDDISDCKKGSMTDVQAYNRIYEKYSSICSDYIIKSSIKKIYEVF